MAELNETNNQKPIENEENNNETVDTTAAEVENHQETDDKADKIVEKLQKRIGEEQAKKNEYKDQLNDALTRIAKLEKGEDPDKPAPKDEKDERIAALEAQIKRRDITEQARDVLVSSGMNVPSDVLDRLVSDDNKATLANVKSFVTYIQLVREDARKELLAGTTPKDAPTGGTTKKLKDMSLAERSQLASEDMALYQQLRQQK
jgi:hypothetical protein